jgi:hypothetical protein
MAGLLAEASGLELVGATVEMDLPELGAVGPALVVDLKPCPAIPAGPGQVITATFKHASADVVDLVLSDYPVNSPGTPDDVAFSSSPSAISPSTSAANPSTPETIGVTGNHPFWSLDRLEFVQVGELAIGERLQTLSGDTKWVQQKLPRPGPEPVYNLEVHAEHVYYVGTDGVLAHNAGKEYGGRYADVRNSRSGGQVHHMIGNSVSPYTKHTGPSIWMSKADHKKTASYGSSPEAKKYRAKQAALIAQGRNREAVQMDIDDIRLKFDDKYDGGIKQMLSVFKGQW